MTREDGPPHDGMVRDAKIAGILTATSTVV
jgi:hypothetical protein